MRLRATLNWWSFTKTILTKESFDVSPIPPACQLCKMASFAVVTMCAAFGFAVFVVLSRIESIFPPKQPRTNQPRTPEGAGNLTINQGGGSTVVVLSSPSLSSADSSSAIVVPSSCHRVVLEFYQNH